VYEDTSVDLALGEQYNLENVADRIELANRINRLLKRVGWLITQSPNVEILDHRSCILGAPGNGFFTEEDPLYRCEFAVGSTAAPGQVGNMGLCENYTGYYNENSPTSTYPCCGYYWPDGSCHDIGEPGYSGYPRVQVRAGLCGQEHIVGVEGVDDDEPHAVYDGIICGKVFSNDVASFNVELFKRAVDDATVGKDKDLKDKFTYMKDTAGTVDDPGFFLSNWADSNWQILFNNASLVSGDGNDEVRRITFEMHKFLKEIDKISKTSVFDCADVLSPDSLEGVESVADMGKISAYMACAGDQIRQYSSSIVIPNLPIAVVDSIVAGGGSSSHYPDMRGAYLDQINSVESNILAFERLSNDLSNVLYQMSTSVALAQQQLRLAEIRGKIEALQMEKSIVLSTGQLVQTIFNAVASMSVISVSHAASGAFSAYGYMAYAAALGMAIAIDEEILDLIDESTESEMKIIMQENLKQLSVLLTDLKNTYVAIKDAHLSIVNGLNDLDTLQHSAEKALAKASFAGSDDSRKVFYVNNVMRKRYNTTQIRYEKAHDDAKKMAYVARRAIEFRLGIDLSEITNATLEDPPSTWADSVCMMQGIDYSNVRDDVGADPEIANYADAYIGDYVTRLENYVESYSFDNPFSEADDIAVFSLKNDLLIPYGPCDSRPSPNMLYYSDNIGYGQWVASEDESETWVNGWEIRGCLELDPRTCTENCEDICLEVRNNQTFCTDTVDDNVECTDVGLASALGEYYSRADLIQDLSADCIGEEYCPRIPEAIGQNSGYLSQRVRNLGEGVFLLSWKDMFPTIDTVGTYSINYGSEYELVINSGEDTITVAEPGGPVICADVTSCAISVSSLGSYETWYERDLVIENHAIKDIELQVHPSPGSGAEYGMVWLAEWQLERLKTEEIPSASVTSPEYHLTTESLEYQPWGCSNPGGGTLRSFFTFKCPNDDLDDSDCYYETSFDISLEEIESGVILNNHAIALDNYNYKHASVAVNMVGSNVRDCTMSDSPSSCYSYGYLPYTVLQDGHVSVRNHEMKQMEYTLPVAKINYGKALTAEVVLTNPLSGSQSSLIAPYVNNELRGRPLQGTYTIRIYNVPELMWANVDDIQLMWNYHYWTKFGE
jgi:hypothetical protein